jgi:hypothetical protein
MGRIGDRQPATGDRQEKRGEDGESGIVRSIK